MESWKRETAKKYKNNTTNTEIQKKERKKVK